MRVRIEFYLCVIFIILYFDHLSAIRWLSLQHSKIKWSLSDESSGRGTRSGFRSPCTLARKRYGLAKFQAKLCRTSVEIMPHVQKAASLAARSCKNTFQHRRWNCSSIDTAPHLTPDLTRATREQAFVYAIGSASLVYTMAKACSSGNIPYCTCATEAEDALPNEEFKWGGCADNVKWATKFTKRFIDTIERYNLKGNNNNNNNHNVKLSERESAIHDRKFKKIKNYVSAMNLHNNRIGRKVILENLMLQCKCHGVSGSCNIKTCWKSIPSLEDIGHKLLRKFTNAKEVSKNQLILNEELYDTYDLFDRTRTNKEELIYLTKSPDYCTKDIRLGSFGTTGRKCNVTSNGTESCRQLCCGRGYRTVVEEKVERCHCKYHYCCYVTCKTCKSVTQRYECS